jgi:hypothetical protein
MTDKEDAMKTRPGAKLAAMSGLLILTLLLLSLRSSRSQPIRLEPTPNPVLNPPDRPLRVAVIDVFYPGDGAFDSEEDRQFQLLLHDAVDIDGDRRRDPYYHGDIVSIFLGSTGVDVVPHRIVDMRDPKHQILGHLRRILWRVRSGETMDAVLLAWESSALESSFGEIPTTDRERRYRDEVRSWSDGSDSWRQTSAIIEALGDLTRAGVEVYTIAGNAGRGRINTYSLAEGVLTVGAVESDEDGTWIVRNAFVDLLARSTFPVRLVEGGYDIDEDGKADVPLERTSSHRRWPSRPPRESRVVLKGTSFAAPTALREKVAGLRSGSVARR